MPERGKGQPAEPDKKRHECISTIGDAGWFLAEDRKNIVGVVPLVCLKSSSEEGVKY